jgi:hypothetical protein
MIDCRAGMRPLLGSIIATFFFFAPPTAACSCVGGSIRSCPVPTSDTIVLATVVSKEVLQRGPAPLERQATPSLANRAERSQTISPQREPWGSVKVALSVSEWFRGKSGNSIIVRTEISTTACGYPFEVGHEYLVFAEESQGTLAVTICSATQPAKMAAATIRQLRSLRDGTALPPIFGIARTHPADWSQTGWEQVRPVPGVTLTARSERGNYRTQTADDGSYEFQGLPTGQYQLRLEPPVGHVALSEVGVEQVGVTAWPGNSCPMNFEVYYDGRISGTIVGSDGKPIAGFLSASYVGPEQLHAGAIGTEVKNGFFEIPRLAPGRYELVFQPSGDGRSSTRAIYYPGTEVKSEATLIELGEGTHVDGLLLTIF